MYLKNVTISSINKQNFRIRIPEQEQMSKEYRQTEFYVFA